MVSEPCRKGRLSLNHVRLQGIDINHKNDRKTVRRAPKSDDPYIRVLSQVCNFIIKLKMELLKRML